MLITIKKVEKMNLILQLHAQARTSDGANIQIKSQTTILFKNKSSIKTIVWAKEKFLNLTGR